MSVPGYDEFELDLGEAIRRDLPGFVSRVPMAKLEKEIVERLPETQGVYALYIFNEIVYVGKTDAQKGFNYRLTRHFEHVQHRHGLDPSRMRFRAVRIMVFNMFDVEKILIAAAGGDGDDAGRAPWNNSGFGSNDPGRKRDFGDASDFDLLHPINIDIPLSFLTPGDYQLTDLLRLCRRRLPYILRYDRGAEVDDLIVEVGERFTNEIAGKPRPSGRGGTAA